jgi:hypothetical protein
VGRRHLRADAGRPLRHDGIREADGVDAAAHERVGQPGGAGGVADHHRHDRVGAGQDVEAKLGHAGAEMGGVREEPLAQLARALDQVERAQAGGGDRRGEAVREEIGPGALAQELDDLRARGHVAAAGAAHRLAERPGEDVDTADHVVQLVGAATARSHEADRVRVVHHHDGVVALGQVADRGQRGQVAVHREHAVGGDQPVAGIGRVAQAPLELVHVAVCEPQPAGLAEADAVDDRGVVERIGDDRVLGAEQRLEEAAVGVEARAVQDRILAAEEARQPLLELAVHLLGAADEAHRRHAVAPPLERLPRGRHDLGVVGQTQVVVGAQVQHLALAGDADVRGLRRLDQVLALVQAGAAQLLEPAAQVVAKLRVHRQTPVQSSTTLPDCPEPATANPSANSV